MGVNSTWFNQFNRSENNSDNYYKKGWNCEERKRQSRKKKGVLSLQSPIKKKFEDGIKKNKIKIKNKRKEKRKMKGAYEKRGTYFYCQVF